MYERQGTPGSFGNNSGKGGIGGLGGDPGTFLLVDLNTGISTSEHPYRGL